MVAVSECPGAEQLRGLLLGELTDEAAEAVERHVEQCPRCGKLLPTIGADDDLVAAMRARSTLAPDTSESATFDDLRRRLYDLAKSAPAGVAKRLAAIQRPADFDPVRLLRPPERDDELGRLGPYRVLKLLGQGGMGAVFVAEDPHLERIVALKVMLPHLAKRDSARERFLREARAAAQIEHDHIVTIYQVGEDAGVPFVAMQLLKGSSLEEALQHPESRNSATGVSLDDALRIVREIAVGLSAAHERGLVHRDVKPANIWLESGNGRVKILDFGLAEIADRETGLTRPDAIVGTAAYMAPEQARGDAVDARADLFSLGCVMYRLCTGREPWQARDPAETIIAASTTEPTPIRELNPNVSEHVERLVMSLLAKEPANRPQSAAAVAEAIAEIEKERAAGRGTFAAALPAARRRRRIAVGIGLAGVAAVIAAVVYVQTGSGTLRIETFDDDVRVLVEQGGKVVEVLDREHDGGVRLHVGQYDLRLDKPSANARLDKSRVEITRGETVVAKIERVPPPTAAPTGDPRSIVNSIGMRLAPIPAGKFLMGSPPTEVGRVDDEEQHEVAITKPFYMQTTCVTVGQFRNFVDDAGYKPEGGDAWMPTVAQSDTYPVGNVSWNDAVAFCKWLSKKEQRTYRLPTEAEWEYACRAGSTTAYFFGETSDKLGHYAWFAGNNAARAPYPVGLLQPNPWGLYDMYGNQWQWVADWYAADYYGHSPKEDPTGPETGEFRVMRGTSHPMPPNFSRSAFRHGTHEPSWAKPHVGFRVVLQAQDEKEGGQ